VKHLVFQQFLANCMLWAGWQEISWSSCKEGASW